MSTGYIYVLHNGDHRIRYVGQTVRNPKVRFREHKNDARKGMRNPKLDWMRKYGVENIVMNVLWEGPVEYLDEMEMEIIAQARIYRDPMNDAIGGAGSRGYRHTPEARERISTNLTGLKKSEEHRKSMSLARTGAPGRFAGRKHTEATLKKMSEAQKGRTISEKARTAVAKSNVKRAHARYHTEIIKEGCIYCVGQ